MAPLRMSGSWQDWMHCSDLTHQLTKHQSRIDPQDKVHGPPWSAVRVCKAEKLAQQMPQMKLQSQDPWLQSLNEMSLL